MISYRIIPILLGAALILIGCEPDAPQDEPPAEWQTAEEAWWHPDADSAEVFRDLETLEDMGITDEEVPVDLEEATRDQIVRAVQDELKPLYQHHPDIMDTLFTEVVEPMIDDADMTMEGGVIVSEITEDAYEEITEGHFREPQAITELTTDVSITYPEELRDEGPEGTVRTRVYVNEEGRAASVRLIEGVHPELDAIAMNAATRMEWEPAYIMEDGEWVAHPSWTDFDITFQAPPG